MVPTPACDLGFFYDERKEYEYVVEYRDTWPCVPCPAGHYSDVFPTNGCEACPPGRSQAREGQTNCTVCTPGRFAANSSSEICDICLQGKYNTQVEGTECKLCPSGRFISDRALDPAKHDTREDCKYCNPGKLSVEDRSECGDCDPGEYIFNRTSCVSCPEGKYSPAAIDDDCVVCGAGFFTNLPTRASECLECSAGTYSHELSTACLECGPGTYSEGQAASCRECSPGYFGTNYSASSCTPCQLGRTTDRFGQSECPACPAGQYQEATGQANCSICEVGRFTAEAGADTCFECSVGTYQTVPEATSCIDCPAGRFQSATGQAECMLCERGRYLPSWDDTDGVSCLACEVGTTAPPGSKACEMCQGYDEVVLEGEDGLGLGYVWVNESQACVLCDGGLAGLDCKRGGTILQSAPLRPGYWRTASTSVDLLKCELDDLCPGGNETTTCLPGHEGPYCMVCGDGYYQAVDYTCSACDEMGRDAILTLLVLFLIFCAIIYGIRFMFRRKKKDKKKKKKKNAQSDTAWKSTLKILFVFLQTLASLGDVFAVAFPNSFTIFISIVALPMLELPILNTGTDCLFPKQSNHYGALVAITLAPLVLILITYLCYLNSMRNAKDGQSLLIVRGQYMALAVLLMYVTLPVCTKMIFRTFVCEQFDNGDRRLMVDYSLDCDAPLHAGFIAYSVLMILVYPVGIPVLFIVMLFSLRGELLHDSKENEKAAEATIVEATLADLEVEEALSPDGKAEPIMALGTGATPSKSSVVMPVVPSPRTATSPAVLPGDPSGGFGSIVLLKDKVAATLPPSATAPSPNSDGNGRVDEGGTSTNVQSRFRSAYKAIWAARALGGFRSSTPNTPTISSDGDEHGYGDEEWEMEGEDEQPDASVADQEAARQEALEAEWAEAARVEAEQAERLRIETLGGDMAIIIARYLHENGIHVVTWFNGLDEDGNGELEFEEFWRGVYFLEPQFPRGFSGTIAEKEGIFRKFDRDDSDTVTLDDLIYNLRFPREANPKLEGISMLYDSYEPDKWYWEVVVTLRRLFITGFLIAFERGTVSQLILGILVAFSFAILQAVVSPFTTDNTNMTALSAEVNTFIILLIGLVGKADSQNLKGSQGQFLGWFLISLVLTTVIIGFGAEFKDAYEEYKEERATKSKPIDENSTKKVGHNKALSPAARKLMLQPAGTWRYLKTLERDGRQEEAAALGFRPLEDFDVEDEDEEETDGERESGEEQNEEEEAEEEEEDFNDQSYSIEVAGAVLGAEELRRDPRRRRRGRNHRSRDRDRQKDRSRRDDQDRGRRRGDRGSRRGRDRSSSRPRKHEGEDHPRPGRGDTQLRAEEAPTSENLSMSKADGVRSAEGVNPQGAATAPSPIDDPRFRLKNAPTGL